MNNTKRMRLTTISALLLTAMMATPCSAMDLLGETAPAASSGSANCYVGCKPKAGVPTNCAVACGNDTHNGTSALYSQGRSTIVMGPTTWNRCAQKMRALGIRGW